MPARSRVVVIALAFASIASCDLDFGEPFDATTDCLTPVEWDRLHGPLVP